MRDAMVEPRDRAQQADGVGMLWIGEELADRRALDNLAGIHDGDFVTDLGDDAEIMRDQDDRGVARGLELTHQIEDLRLQRHVERGGGFVGDEKTRVAGQRHCDHDALAHAAGQLVWIFVDALFRRGDVHAAQKGNGALARLAPRTAAMAQDDLHDLVADGEARIERGHRLLEDHGEPVAPEVAQRLVGYLEKVEAVEPDGAGDLGGALWQEAHDGERGDALAAAGFADEAKRRAVRDGEIDPVDGMGDTAIIAVKNHAQTLYFDQRR
jgi:hypothetical protein